MKFHYMLLPRIHCYFCHTAHSPNCLFCYITLRSDWIVWASNLVNKAQKGDREREQGILWKAQLFIYFILQKKHYCQYAASLTNKYMQLNTCYKALTLPLRKKQPQIPNSEQITAVPDGTGICCLSMHDGVLCQERKLHIFKCKQWDSSFNLIWKEEPKLRFLQ